MTYIDTWPHTRVGSGRAGKLGVFSGHWAMVPDVIKPPPPEVMRRNLERVPRGCVQGAAASTEAFPREQSGVWFRLVCLANFI